MADVVHPMVELKTSGVSKKVPQFVAAAAVSLGAVIAGTVLAWTSPVLPQLDPLINPNSTLPVTSNEGSWVGSLLAIGAVCGAIPAGYCADRFGRKLTVLFLAVPFILNWVLIVFAQNVAMLYIARLFAGLATGAICVTAPMYNSEIAEQSLRGILGVFFQLFLCVGILFSFIVGAFVDWVNLSIISGTVVIAFVVSFFFMPETPVYYLKINKVKEAKKSILWLRGKDCDVNGILEELQAQIDASPSENASIKELIQNKVALRGLIVGLGLMMGQQLSGINAVIFYTVPIFRSAGSSLDPSIAAIIIGAVQVIVCIVGMPLMEKAGRKIMLFQSSIMMCICLIILGVYFKLQANGTDVTSIGWIPLVSLVIFIISFSMGFGPIPWMMMGELFAPDVKGLASGLTVMANWLLVFLVTKLFPNLLDWFGSHTTFWIFAGFMVATTVFVYFLVPETKGKSLSEIQIELGGGR